MKTIHTTLDKQLNIGFFQSEEQKASSLFFDIETTGLQSRAAILYLIGAIYFSDDDWHMIQWFNDDGESEADLILSFYEFCEPFTHLCHYNGDRFDIPFIKQRADTLQLSVDFDQFTSVDYYILARAYKKQLQLNHLSQVDIETFFHHRRVHYVSGKDLIKEYFIYLKTKDAIRESALLQHNADDVSGLLTVTYLGLFASLANGEFHISNYSRQNDMLLVSIKPSIHLPVFHLESIAFLLDSPGMDSDTLAVHISLPNQQIRNYYADYRNYVYLPSEDRCIPLALASCVDNRNKQKATKETCYTTTPYRDDLFDSTTLHSYLKNLFHIFLS
ncbi:MAG: ribonuclease H-like domain-containing protein [Lachnospiraceae bacterium]